MNSDNFADRSIGRSSQSHVPVLLRADQGEVRRDKTSIEHPRGELPIRAGDVRPASATVYCECGRNHCVVLGGAATQITHGCNNELLVFLQGFGLHILVDLDLLGEARPRSGITINLSEQSQKTAHAFFARMD
jgi:hypothetical protein